MLCLSNLYVHLCSQCKQRDPGLSGLIFYVRAPRFRHRGSDCITQVIVFKKLCWLWSWCCALHCTLYSLNTVPMCGRKICHLCQRRYIKTTLTLPSYAAWTMDRLSEPVRQFIAHALKRWRYALSRAKRDHFSLCI